MPETVGNTKRRRFLPRWSMATMFFGVTAVCVVLALMVRPAEQQKRAVKALRAFEFVKVNYSYELDGQLKPKAANRQPGPDWLRELIGVDYFANVAYVELSSETIAPLLAVQNEVTIPCTVVRLLGKLDDLKSLDLSAAPITDREIDHFLSSRQLRKLNLRYSFITDAGLTKLQGLTELKELDLNETAVSKEGVARLKKALPNCKIECGF